MPVTPSPLALALAVALATGASAAGAQTLPRRANVEAVSVGDVERDAQRDRHVVAVAPGRPVLAPIDGGRVLDLDLREGPAPDVWTSQGGALLVRHAVHQLDPGTFTVDTLSRGRRWLRLESDGATRAEIHVRTEGRRAGADPWLVPVDPVDERATRSRPGRRDHVLRLATQPVRFLSGSAGPLRLDLWRTRQPRLLPADATWLRVEADGQTVFDGRVPTPVEREHLFVTDHCAEVLDLAGRMRVDLPAGTREVRVHGEPGVWLKVLAPLPGTPVDALDVASDPTREQLVARPDEPIDRAFDRAVWLFPDPLAEAFLARYAYARPVALHPSGDGALSTRRWRARFPDRDRRAQFEINRPAPGEDTVTALAFHWLPAGASWHIDTAAPGRAALLRIAVAHPEKTEARPASLRLEQAGRAAVELRLDPVLVQMLEGASSAADGLLALDPEGAPIVDASQVLVPRADAATPSTLVNTGPHGVWIAVDQRVPALRQLAEGALDAELLAPERVQDALLTAATAIRDDAGAPEATRDIDQARRLIGARAARFGGEPCVTASARGAVAVSRSLALFAKARGSDPVLTRCAVLQAFAAAPDEPRVRAAFDDWAVGADQGELQTGAYAWVVTLPTGRRDRAAWARLSQALAAEGEATAATLAARAAHRAPVETSIGTPVGTPVASTEALPAESAAALVRLRTERNTEVAYALASHAAPARWVLDRAGSHTLELRATAQVPQWVRLRSAARSWWMLLPAVDAEATTLRNVATGTAPGVAVRVPFEAAAAGQALSIEPASGAVLVRLEAPTGGLLAGSPLTPTETPERSIAVRARVASSCRVERVDALVPIHSVGDPGGPATDPRAIAINDSAPVTTEDGVPRTAVQAALQALRLIEAGHLEQALAAAARALAMREADPGVSAPGVFGELDRHLAWRRVEPETHGGVRERAVADGRSTQPLVARREHWAGLDDEDGFVLRTGQGWVLEGLQPGQAVQLRLRVYSALSDRVEVRTTRGEVRRLRDGVAAVVTDAADARGQLHLRVGDALPGTFVALDVADAAGMPLDGRRPVVYHRGPVTVRLAGPTLLRVVEWDGLRSDVRTEPVGAAGRVRIASRRPAGAMRISALVLEPARPRAAAAPAAAPVTDVVSAPRLPAAPPDLAPPPAAWPQLWPNSGGEDGTWGLQAARQQRTDADDREDKSERFGELRWRWRWHASARGLWGRLDVVGRRHAAGFGVLGLQHDLEWHQADGPWGASLNASAWRQTAPAGLASPAHSASVRAAMDWSGRRDERWRDDWEVGLRWRALSLRDVDERFAAGLDNDVYSRYRDRHRRQADVNYRLTWRARYDSEWVLDAQAVSNDLSTVDVDNVGAGIGWRWARHGWTTSAGLDLRRYLCDDDRREASTRERFEFAVGKLLLGADDGWRLRLAAGYDASSRQAHGGLSVEWFDHDGRGLEDLAPSELFLRGVTEADLAGRPLGPELP